jgi:hypothetical protein
LAGVVPVPVVSFSFSPEYRERCSRPLEFDGSAVLRNLHSLPQDVDIAAGVLQIADAF